VNKGVPTRRPLRVAVVGIVPPGYFSWESNRLARVPCPTGSRERAAVFVLSMPGRTAMRHVDEWRRTRPRVEVPPEDRSPRLGHPAFGPRRRYRNVPDCYR